MSTKDSGDISASLRPALKSQYHAALAMLREAVERCPEDEWTNRDHVNAFWQIAYHTLFFAHMYLMPNEAAFVPWAGQHSHAQHPDGIPGRIDPESPLSLIPEPYSQQEVLEYWTMCDGMVDAAIDRMDLGAADCGISWYNMSKLEHQLVNIRHIQHHGAQLADRLRSAADIGISWVGGRS